jgi:cation diffusion facilitator CzcD-associated flavoprotein CzcO
LACRAFLFTQVRDAELRRKLTPEYGFGCKRPSVSNTYYSTFTRANTELVTDPIERITAAGILTADGVERPIDTLVLATGFRLSHDPENYRKAPVTGSDGFDLADFFEHEPLQAYEGVSLPQLPNTFMIFGPYSWTGSSWHVMVEMQSHHAVRVITEARRRGATRAAVTPEANARFLSFVRRRSQNSLLYTNNCATANTYYFDHHGDFSLLRPTTAIEAWWSSRRFSLDDYAYETLARSVADSVAA